MTARRVACWPLARPAGYIAGMITGVHTLIYSDDAEATREYLTRVLQWPALDTGGGWLIYATGPSELGVHPTGTAPDMETGEEVAFGPHHEISLMCDDIVATVDELRGRGGVFTRQVRDDGWGLTIPLAVPGADDVLLFQPRYAPPALGLEGR